MQLADHGRFSPLRPGCRCVSQDSAPKGRRCSIWSQDLSIAQTLMALVELRVLHRVQTVPMSASDLGRQCDLPVDWMQVLLQAGAALGLPGNGSDGRFATGCAGGGMLGVLAGSDGPAPLLIDLADPDKYSSWRQKLNLSGLAPRLWRPGRK
jgi:hypothetical protein